MRLTLSFFFLFLGAVLLLIPNITRRGILFAVPIPSGFRDDPVARKAIAIFRALVAGITIAGLCGALLLPESLLNPLASVEPMLILVTAGLAFVWQNRRLRPFAIQPPLKREAEISGAPDRIPGFTWLAAGPFAIIAAAAVYLQSNWQNMPARFPTHWGLNGQPHAWSERTTQGVYGPLLFAAALCAWLLVLALSGWFGARRSSFRRAVLGTMIATEYLVGLLFAATSINPLIHIPMWIPIVAPLLFVIATLIVMARSVAEPRDAVEPTPNDCWKAGMIYYNPADAALMVEKRAGVGYTFNFANRWSWVLLAGLVLVLGLGITLR